MYSHSKEQLVACGKFIKEITIVKGSCLRDAEIENLEVSAMGIHRVLPKVTQIL
jgi:hypothetical protein